MRPADLEKGNGQDQFAVESCELQDNTNSTDEYTVSESGLLNRFPKPLQRIILWTKGPSPRREHSIRPFFPKIQRAPVNILDRLCKRLIWKKIAFLFVSLVWLCLFTLLIQRNESPPQVPGFGTPKRLSCAASLW
jgi:hypothetical protein